MRGDGVPPLHLLRFDPEDWLDAIADAGPEPEWWDRQEPHHVFLARREWSCAPRQWVREHGGTMDAVNLLYPPDLDAGEVDPRFAERERRVLLAVAAPRARREG